MKCIYAAKPLHKQVQLNIDPNTKISELGLGQQQLVEIAKALNKQVRLNNFRRTYSVINRKRNCCFT